MADNVIPFPKRACRGDAVSLNVDGHGDNLVAALFEGLQRAIAMLPPGRVRISVTVESLEPPDGERAAR